MQLYQLLIVRHEIGRKSSARRSFVLAASEMEALKLAAVEFAGADEIILWGIVPAGECIWGEVAFLTKAEMQERRAKRASISGEALVLLREEGRQAEEVQS